MSFKIKMQMYRNNILTKIKKFKSDFLLFFISIHRKKHIILKTLKEQLDKDTKETFYNRRNLFTNKLLPKGSLIPLEISNKTILNNPDEIKRLCNSLKASNYITNGKTELGYTVPTTYVIDELGEIAITEKLFLNKILIRKFDFWKWIIPFFTSILALANSIWHWWG